MNGDPRSGARAPQAELPEVRATAKDPPVNRWLAIAVAILSLAVIALGVALVVESGSEEAAPTRQAFAQQAVAPGMESSTAASDGAATLLLAQFEKADRPLVRHVDGGIRAYRDGDPQHFECGGYGCSGPRSGSYFRYDQARGWSGGDVFAVVGSPDVERTSPVVLVAGSPGSGSWTVAFSVRAGAEEQLWIQHWEEPWGEWLQEMWVI